MLILGRGGPSMSGKRRKLPLRQVQFVEEYLVDLNATKAAKRAGYSEKTAYSQGQRLLKNVEIQALLQERRAKLSEKLEISAERVLQEQAKLAFYNVLDLFNDDGTMKPISEIQANLGAAINGLDIVDITSFKDDDGPQVLQTLLKKVKFHDKGKALDALSKHLGLYEVDNTQRGNADLKTRKEFIDDLLSSLSGSTTGLPKPRKKNG
jgi:phage terminase small subunit